MNESGKKIFRVIKKQEPVPISGALSVTKNNSIRLNKRMADLGLCSRREADEWIAKGCVRINGQVASLGMQVSDFDHIVLAKEALAQQERWVTILYHKPLGIVSGQAEDGHVAAVQMIKGVNRWTQDRAAQRFMPAQLKHLVPAGRLDVDSTGLLVLTQDGRVASSIIGEMVEVEKEYLVRVAWTGMINHHAQNEAQSTYAKIKHDVTRPEVRTIVSEKVLHHLRHGLSLDGKPLKPSRIDWVNADQLRFVLTEGKKRQIRRMCELVGLKVLSLKRVRVGQVMLGDLPLGQWRYLRSGEHF